MILIFIILLIFDFFYINLVSKPLFDKMIKKITHRKPKYNIIGAIFAYILILICLQYFIINKKMTPFDAFILGIIIYGVFDMTNLALFEGYDLKIAILDMLWGGILFFIVTKIYYNLNNIKIK